MPLLGCATTAASRTDDWRVADAIAAAIRRPVFRQQDFTITRYGAREGGAVDALPAIRAAIGACHDAGGGRVVVPAGLWRVDGPINLRSNVDLHVADGATLRFSPDPALYLPQVLTRWEGTEAWNYSPMLYTRGATNIALTGGGTYDGQGQQHFLPWRARQGPAQARLRRMGNDGAALHDRVFGTGDWLRPAFVQFFDCSRVLVDGPRFVDSPFWVIHPVYCRDVTIRNTTVISRHINSDGCDPDSCTNVLIEHCRFDVSDDCIAIKSGRDQDGWRVARPSSRIVVRDCDMQTNVAAAFGIGSEMSGGVHDVFVEKLRVSHAEYALYFKANLDRGGVVERICIRDVAIAQCAVPIQFTTAYHSWRGGNYPPTYRDFVIEDLRCAAAGKALHIVGVPTAPVQDVRLSRVRIDAATNASEIAHATGLLLDDVSVNGSPFTV